MFVSPESPRSRRRRQGFSLVELAIVLSVIGVLLAGIWTLASTGRQRMHVEQAVEAVIATVDATRAAYGGLAVVTGDMSIVVPYLINHNAMPVNLIRSGASVADTPWGVTTDANGSFRVCAWGATTMPTTVGTVPSVPCTVTTVTSTTTTSQYFAIELTSLDYASCIGMAEGITPEKMPGLAALYVNGTIGDTTSGQTVSSTFISTNCLSAGGNVVDFVYRLHPPSV